jgi:protein-tyrosine phosphatase
LGNICRSPLAEAELRRAVTEAGLNAEIDSAGTGGWHIGDSPDGRAIVAGRIRGLDLSGITARLLTYDDFVNFDLIVAMDKENVIHAEEMRPIGNETPLVLLSSFGTGLDGADIPDPYYTGRFDPVIDMIKNCAEGLIAQLRAEQ